MVFFDFDELEVQAPQAAQAPQAPDTKSVKLRAEPQAARGQAAQAALALQVSRAQETSTLKDPSEKTYQILQKVPSNSEDIVELTLKMYESKDQSLKISSQATVQELQHQLTPSFGSLRLTGAQVGARERFRRREKGWALEGHQALRPEDQLQTLRFNAVLLCQPRLGPVAEIDLQPLRKEVQRAQPGPARAVTTASPGDKVVTSVKSAKSKELERSFPSKPLAQKVQHRWSKTQEDQGAKPPEDLFAQALEMELEIDRRLCLHKHVPKHLEIQHGVFAWSATRIFLVDALNEVLAQMKQAVQGSFLYTKELLCGFALTSLCEALQKLMLEQNEALREIYWSMARPGGLRDEFRRAAALARPQRSLQEAQAMPDFGPVLRQLESIHNGDHKARAISALSEELRNPQDPCVGLEQLGLMRLLRTSSTSMTSMLSELRAEYKKKSFQEQYKQIQGPKRPLFVLKIQSNVLPKYGFSGDAKGVLNMKMEVGLLSRKDRVIWKLMMDIHKLLDLPDSAATEILTLDFGAANEVEREVTSVYQQALQLSTFEKLVAARLHRHKRSLLEGLELLCVGLSDPLQPASLAPSALAAFGTASRETYVLTGAPRRRFALDILNHASGVIATQKALEIVPALCLAAHPLVIAKSEALDLVERELPRCFQQPEVNAAPLLLQWQRGERDIDAAEESGVSALHLAAGDNHKQLLNALLLLNAKRDQRDHLGRTAAHWAAMRAQPCLQLLQHAGFDLHMPDLHGRTPLAMAQTNGME